MPAETSLKVIVKCGEDRITAHPDPIEGWKVLQALGWIESEPPDVPEPEIQVKFIEVPAEEPPPQVIVEEDRFELISLKELENNYIRKVTEYGEENNIPIKELAKKLGISEPGFYNKRKRLDLVEPRDTHRLNREAGKNGSAER